MPDSRQDETFAATTPYGEEGPPSPVEDQTFRAGDDVAGRYRIVRFIARGGMGEVYEAEDRELRTRVALKTIRPEIAADPAMMERFRREIHLAHRITHPNVSRVYDLGFDREGGRSVTFLTMELLDGETLAARVARLGRLSSGDALPIVAQMAAALDAAHEVGIVHRDFKSGNVLLVESDKGLRAVVTDFGLARAAAGQDGFAASMTGTGAVAGTPLYMAPEQVEGSEVTAAADVYALGVVMFEMVTGKWPFVGDSAISTAVKRLKEPPPSPRSRVPELDRRWETAILRCLERHPADRFARAGDVARALAGETVPSRKRMRRTAVGAIAAVVAVAAGLGWYFAHRGQAGRAAKTRPSVAVLGFKNLAGRPDAAWLSTALSEMLTTELAAGETLRTIPGETVAKLKVSLALPDSDSYAKDTLAKIRGNIDAGYVVLGSYLAVTGAPLRVDLKLQDAAAGETIAAVSDSGTEAQIADLVSRVAARLREKLGAGSVSPAQAAAIRASLPSSPEGARLYAEGLSKLRLFDYMAARELLEKAVAADPAHALSRAALADTYMSLGDEAKAQASARRALELSSGLSREDRLWIEGRARETTHEWDAAIAAYRSLFSSAPDNLEYGLRLLSAQNWVPSAKAGRLATIAALRRLPPPSGDDPRIDLAEIDQLFQTGEYKRAREIAARAETRARERGARLVETAALVYGSSAAFQMGETDKSMEMCERARRTYVEIGDRLGEVKTIQGIELCLQAQGRLAEARTMAEQHIAILREMGAAIWLPGALVNLSFIAGQQGDVAVAKRAAQESLEAFRANKMKIGDIYAGGNLADALVREGRLAEAVRLEEPFLGIAREAGDSYGVSLAQSGQSWLRYLQGDIPGAQKALEEALTIVQKSEARTDTASALAWRAELSRQGDRLPEARRDLEEAIKLQQGTGDTGRLAEMRVALARLSIEEAKPADAIAPVREAREVFRKQGRLGDEIDAGTALAEAQLALGKTIDARVEVESADLALKKSLDQMLRVQTEIVAARVRAAEGDGAGAIRDLERTLSDATRFGFVPLQLDARLALGQIEMKTGRAASGRARLDALERDAKAKGFLLVARRAGAARV